MKFPNLSGSDYFHLLVDRKMLRNNLVGNISRIQLELDSECDLEELGAYLKSNPTLKAVSALQVKIGWPLLPRWIKRSTSVEMVKVHSNLSQNEFRSVVLNRKVDNENGLVFIDLCNLDDGSKHAVVSMHHVLFDHQGMLNFLKCLSDNSASMPLFHEAESPSVFKTISIAASMTVYMLKRSSGKLGTLVGPKVRPKSLSKFHQISFTVEESNTIADNAWNAGSRIGHSSYYQAVCSIAVQNALKDRGENPPYLWFSVPNNLRRKGAEGHLVSNQLSFLFYRCLKEDLDSVQSAVSSINHQLKEQVRKAIANRYSILLDALRTMPLPVYEWMVDLASKGKMSSFGFSDLGTFKNPISEFQGVGVLGSNHYPPVPSPPGLNFAFYKENDRLNIVLAFVDEAVSKNEISEIDKSLRKLMLDSE